MDLNGTLSESQIDVLFAVYLSCLTPSVLGSFSVLVVSIVRWKHLKEQVLLLVQLALADLIAALILVFSTSLNKRDNADNVILCQYSLPLSLTFYFISFLLVIVYAWKSKTAIHGWRAAPAEESPAQSHCQRTFVALPVYLLVWLLPLVMYVAYVHSDFMSATPLLPANKVQEDGLIEKYCSSCIMFLHVGHDPCPGAEKRHDTFIRLFLVIVVIPVILSCSVIYYKVGKWYQTQERQCLFPVEGDGRSRKRFKSMFSIARNMVMVILFCWTPALLLILLSFLVRGSYLGQSHLFPVFVLQAATVSLQGFLNSMVYAWRRPNFTSAVLGETTPLLPQHRLPFFDESLRVSF
ncbi:transmembrane protein 116 [Synchiropus picturatus]